jgi:chromosome segregation ATPase
MSQDREALRVEVEKLRKALEDLQVKHAEELSAVRNELEESESAKDQAQTQYQNLLGRVNTIKSTLGERMAADRRELAEAKDQIDELEGQNESLKASTQNMEAKVSKLREESEETSKELSSLRNRHNLSQQNWLREREDLIQQNKNLKDEAEAAKEAMGDWEVLAMEERSIREGLADRVAELEDQLSAQKESYERAASERDSQSQAVDGLQRALQEIQEARRVELRETVETSQSQLNALNKLVQQAESRAAEAEAAREALTRELERAAPFEKEVKEKNLLIGKLRHEAIILNDHLAKALRFLKRAKPEDNIDRYSLHCFYIGNHTNKGRQIVTNHFLQFLTLDRSDPKKFQILQIIAALLAWTDEQKEQAGLARPGAASSSLRLPMSPFHRTPSTPSLSSEFFPDSASSKENKESLAELWTGFLERQAEEGSQKGSRAGSVSSTRPDTRG